MIRGGSADFSREELTRIVTKAENLASTVGMNPLWRRAYEELAQAASTLDAFIARSATVPDKEPQSEPTGFIKKGDHPESLRSVEGSVSLGLRPYVCT